MRLFKYIIQEIEGCQCVGGQLKSWWNPSYPFSLSPNESKLPSQSLRLKAVDYFYCC